MNFEFSDNQKLLKDQANKFLADKCPLTTVRNILEGDEPYDKELWSDIVNMGWTAAVIPEEFDGLGLGYLELCMIAEEMGRSLAPVPFSSSVYLATEALLLSGNLEQKEKYLPKLAAGELIGTVADAEGYGSTTAEGYSVTFKDGRLTGEKVPVIDGDVADFAVVAANGSKGTSLYLVDLNDASISKEVLSTLDPTRSQARLTFNGTSAQLLGEDGAGALALEKVFDNAAVLFAFEQIGAAEAALDAAKDYAMNRYAFGRSIASFQAMKHKMADMFVALELARSNCYYGAWALSTGDVELPVAAATARVSATKAMYQCAKENIQIHGGMGFTWEFDCHFFYRRSKLLADNLGSQSLWEEKLISRVVASTAA